MMRSRIVTTRHGRPLTLGAGAVALAAAVFALAPRSSLAEDARPVPAPAMDEPAAGSAETAILAGGCFWGVQGVFQHVKGVKSAVSGYTGGEASTAHYEIVSTGETGHAESVKVTFDPKQISYGRILQIYFSAAHHPTERDHQGPDYGTQYRSTIFPTTETQAKVAAAYVAQLDAAHTFDAKLATTIEPGRTFYPAEAHHQDFLAHNPTYPYIAINDIPKVEALRRMYPSLYRADPVLVAATAATD
jgi:peptide-methionine (S)-S-oxide reductase